VPEGRCLCLGNVGEAPVAALLSRYGLDLVSLPDGRPITASFWGDPEAGIAGNRVYARRDTPLHSVLHEVAHVVCMSPSRRRALERDAGGDDLEESAACFLQILLADFLPGTGRERLMRDMDRWGYSFRLGSAQNWFEQDAADARAFLRAYGLIDDNCRPTWQLRCRERS